MTTPEDVQRTYLILVLLQTLAASLIWGVNTLFLLDAGLSLTEAFIANAAYTAGMVIFEVPTGVIADTFGRRVSFILGSGDPAGYHRRLSRALVCGGWHLVVDPGLGPDRARFHLLLRGHRGLARRRARSHGLRRRGGAGLRERADGLRCGVVGGDHRRWVPGPGQPRAPLCLAHDPPPRGDPGGMEVDAGPRVPAGARGRDRPSKCGGSSATRSSMDSGTPRSGCSCGALPLLPEWGYGPSMRSSPTCSSCSAIPTPPTSPESPLPSSPWPRSSAGLRSAS